MTESFKEYLHHYGNKLRQIFSDPGFQETEGEQRGIPREVLEGLAATKPSSVSIPEAYGGRGGKPAEILSLLETTSYESLPLSLLLGINGALFLEPVAKYGEERLKDEIFRPFLKNNSLGGLMITEPDYGTDALAMRTSWKRKDSDYKIVGKKTLGRIKRKGRLLADDCQGRKKCGRT